ncbi:hypothetical protein SASPL_121429 [Salvia splendens]|uniref:Uncharacterized protein n=1 Tax=Salvia splendens TaxID=180675 RepID=A0A8X8XSH3_SALSN|nr:hypothetical protein SASPL_121429 [Salvia splendens]
MDRAHRCTWISNDHHLAAILRLTSVKLRLASNFPLPCSSLCSNARPPSCIHRASTRLRSLFHEEVQAIEVNKIDEDDGLHDSSKIGAFDFDGCLAKTSVKGNADTWSLVSPSIPEKLHNRYKDELHDAREDTVDGLKDMSIYSRMGVKRMGEVDNKSFHDTIMRKLAEDVYIRYAIVDAVHSTELAGFLNVAAGVGNGA